MDDKGKYVVVSLQKKKNTNNNNVRHLNLIKWEFVLKNGARVFRKGKLQ